MKRFFLFLVFLLGCTAAPVPRATIHSSEYSRVVFPEVHWVPVNKVNIPVDKPILVLSGEKTDPKFQQWKKWLNDPEIFNIINTYYYPIILYTDKDLLLFRYMFPGYPAPLLSFFSVEDVIYIPHVLVNINAFNIYEISSSEDLKILFRYLSANLRQYGNHPGAGKPSSFPLSQP